MRGLNMSRTVASTCSLTGRGSGGSGFEPCDASGARRREKRKRPSTPEPARMMKRTDLKPFQPTQRHQPTRQKSDSGTFGGQGG